MFLMNIRISFSLHKLLIVECHTFVGILGGFFDYYVPGITCFPGFALFRIHKTVFVLRKNLSLTFWSQLPSILSVSVWSIECRWIVCFFSYLLVSETQLVYSLPYYCLIFLLISVKVPLCSILISYRFIISYLYTSRYNTRGIINTLVEIQYSLVFG